MLGLCEESEGGGRGVNRGQTIRVNDAVKRLTDMVENSTGPDASEEWKRGMYTAIWQIQNNVITVEEATE